MSKPMSEPMAADRNKLFLSNSSLIKPAPMAHAQKAIVITAKISWLLFK
jgi:hypothetical protein